MRRGHLLHAHFDIPGKSPTTLGWPLLRKVMDHYAAALAAMPDGPPPDEIHLLHVEAGSCDFVMAAPPSAVAAAAVLARGPTPTWTEGARERVEPLYAFLRSTGSTLETGMGRRRHKVVVPAPETKLEIEESRTIEGEVNVAGGDDPQVRLRTRSHGLVTCEADRETTQRFGELLYRDVAVTGRAVVNLMTGHIARLVVESYEVLPPRLDAREIGVALRSATAGLPAFSVARLIGERSA